MYKAVTNKTLAALQARYKIEKSIYLRNSFICNKRHNKNIVPARRLLEQEIRTADIWIICLLFKTKIKIITLVIAEIDVANGAPFKPTI